MYRSTYGKIALLLVLLLFLTACGSEPVDMEATVMQMASEIAGTQKALETPTSPPTNTPEPTQTFTPVPTATHTPEPTLTPTEAPCSNVDLNGRYTDFRTWRGAIYGWIMEAEQHGCEFVAHEVFFLRANGPGSQSQPAEITGTIDGTKVHVCYTASGYCLNLAIMQGGEVLANGVEGWYYEKDK